MRWKLLVGLAITWFGLGITGLFQHAGIIPLDTPLFWTLMGPAILEVLPATIFHCTGNCVDGFFVDSAHGPPFLTVSGILLVYVLPSGLLARWTLRKLRARTPSSSTGYTGKE